MAELEIYRTTTGEPASEDDEEARLITVQVRVTSVSSEGVEDIAIESHGETLTQDEMDRAFEVAVEEWEQSDDGKEAARAEQREAMDYREASYRW